VSADELGAIARGIVDSNVYLVLGTADDEGRPWVTPVYYASSWYTDFYWMSSPEATHSRNLAVRPELSLVVFDSRVPVGSGQAVYMSGTAEELSGHELERGIEIYPGERGLAAGARPVTLEELHAPAPYRLYRARVSQHWVLEPGASPDRRTPVTP
jgi:Pyridoxamine 5'-phosphate oxidase